MAAKLYVGNLPFETTKDQLMEVFGKVGQVVEATVITDRMTGRSKGFGFVEMASEEDAKKAVEQLNNTQIGDRTIKVDEARPPKERTDFHQQR